MEIITVQKANKWEDSGKISVQDHNGRWLNVGKFCNDADQLLAMQGQSLMVEIKPWTNPNSGKVTQFVNSWKPADGALPMGGDIPQGYPQAAPQAPQAPNPAKPAVDRDASIVAQALCKCLTHEGVDSVWMAYMTLYRWASKWDPNEDSAPDPTEQQGHPDNDEFDDKIPF